MDFPNLAYPGNEQFIFMEKKEKILITGGLGNLGLFFIDKLKNKYDITVIDNLNNSTIQKAAEVEKMGIEVLLQDVRRRKKANNQYKMVLHLASQINVQNANADPLSDASNNILGTIALLKNFPASRFIYLSSEMVYGKSKNADEESRPDPECPYGFSKLGSEVYIRMFCKKYLILRLAEKEYDCKKLVGVINSLIERDVNGTINIGRSLVLNCNKINNLIINHD